MKINLLAAILIVVIAAGVAHAVALSKNHLTGLGMSPAVADLLAGWTAQTGTNTACDTTCGSQHCIIGLEATSKVFVVCDDATADSCICTN